MPVKVIHFSQQELEFLSLLLELQTVLTPAPNCTKGPNNNRKKITQYFEGVCTLNTSFIKEPNLNEILSDKGPVITSPNFRTRGSQFTF